MSTVLAPGAVPRRPPVEQRPARHLSPVAAPARRRRPRMAYALVAVAGALLIAGAQMFLSVLSTQSAYELASLSQQNQELTWQKQILSDQVAGLSSPQNLAAQAAALGLVVGESPSYLRLSDGAVLGSQEASGYLSSIDPIGRGSVPNAMLDDTESAVADAEAAEGGATAETETDSATPPQITDGLPTPQTH